MKSDEELRKTFEVFVDEENILRVVILERANGIEESTRQAESVEEAVLEIFNKNPREKYKVVVDLLPLKKGKTYTSAQHRKTWARLASHKQNKKCVVIGLGLYLKVVANFIIRLSGKSKDIKWFSDKEKALKWLKDK